MVRVRPIFLVLALAACTAEPPCPSSDLSPPERAPRFAVLLTDYASSAIALLDDRGDVVTESWLDSGTRASGISAGIGGDVFLLDPIADTRLALLERYGEDLLTLAPFDGSSVSQIDVAGDDPVTPSGHSPNPQDAVRIDARYALVSRHNPAVDPRTPELALGNDLVIVDLESGAMTARIPLDADVVVPAPTPDDPGATTIAFARPALLVVLESGDARRAVAGLARVSIAFDTTGPGALAVVDPVALARTQILEIPELTGCGSIAAIPTDPSRAIAVCTGDSFATEDGRRATSGLVRVALAPDGTLAIDATYRAVDHPELAPPTAGLVPLDAARAIVVADPRAEDLASSVDLLLLVDLDADTAAPILEASSSFTLGDGAYDAALALLLVPDAEARAVHRFDVATSGVVHRDTVAVPTCRTLPPRQIVLAAH